MFAGKDTQARPCRCKASFPRVVMLYCTVELVCDGMPTKLNVVVEWLTHLLHI
jgi:hypothetical protein